MKTLNSSPTDTHAGTPKQRVLVRRLCLLLVLAALGALVFLAVWLGAIRPRRAVLGKGDRANQAGRPPHVIVLAYQEGISTCSSAALGEEARSRIVGVVMRTDRWGDAFRAKFWKRMRTRRNRQDALALAYLCTHAEVSKHDVGRRIRALALEWDIFLQVPWHSEWKSFALRHGRIPILASDARALGLSDRIPRMREEIQGETIDSRKYQTTDPARHSSAIVLERRLATGEVQLWKGAQQLWSSGTKSAADADLPWVIPTLVDQWGRPFPRSVPESTAVDRVTWQLRQHADETIELILTPLAPLEMPRDLLERFKGPCRSPLVATAFVVLDRRRSMWLSEFATHHAESKLLIDFLRGEPVLPPLGNE